MNRATRPAIHLGKLSISASFKNLARAFAQATVLALLLLAPTSIAASQGDCAQPVSDGPFPVSADCLFVLQAAVGGAACTPRCICDVNGSGGAPNASDALTCLRAAIGITASLACPCHSPTTTTLPTSGKWDVEFALSNSPTLSSLVVYVGYGEADGQFSGTGNDVACVPLLSADFIQLYDEETGRELGLIFIAATGFTGPTSLARCVFEAANEPSADSFSFYYEALKPDLTPINVVVGITSITPQ